jgi:anti-sigma factor RsiW
MNDSRLSPDDPRLTAYALGQLEGDERAAIEAALREDPALREQVEQTRAFAMQLESALATETTQDAVDAQSARAADSQLGRAAIIPGRDPRVLDGGRSSEYDVPRSKLLSFPQLYYVIGGLAAACVAVMITLRDAPVRVEPKYYREVLLNPTGTATASDDAEKAKSVEAPAPSASSAVAQEQAAAPSLQLPQFELNAFGSIAADAKAARMYKPAPTSPGNVTFNSTDRSVDKAATGTLTLSAARTIGPRGTSRHRWKACRQDRFHQAPPRCGRPSRSTRRLSASGSPTTTTRFCGWTTVWEPGRYPRTQPCRSNCL